VIEQVKILPAETPPRLNRIIWNHLTSVMKAFKDTPVVYDSRFMAYSRKFDLETMIQYRLTDAFGTFVFNSNQITA
jgi:hypothetical protein